MKKTLFIFFFKENNGNEKKSSKYSRLILKMLLDHQTTATNKYNLMFGYDNIFEIATFLYNKRVS